MNTVYGLTDEHGQIRYVGVTSNPVQRFATHRSKQEAFQVAGMAVLALKEDENGEGALAEEVKWIAFFGLSNLINRSPGYPPLPQLEPDSPLVAITCALDSCKRPFLPVTTRQRFHDPRCRDAFHNKIKRALIQRAKRLGIK